MCECVCACVRCGIACTHARTSIIIVSWLEKNHALLHAAAAVGTWWQQCVQFRARIGGDCDGAPVKVSVRAFYIFNFLETFSAATGQPFDLRVHNRATNRGVECIKTVQLVTHESTNCRCR